jgi:hypothetical protein
MSYDRDFKISVIAELRGQDVCCICHDAKIISYVLKTHEIPLLIKNPIMSVTDGGYCC